jgi:hypothetical protein
MRTRWIRFTTAVRTVPPLLWWNLVGVVGLAGFAAGLGGVVGCWWVSLMVGGLLAVGLSYVASTHLAPVAEPVVPPGQATGPARAPDLKSA